MKLDTISLVTETEKKLSSHAGLDHDSEGKKTS